MNPPSIDDLRGEQQALLFSLGLPGDPVALDIKPVGMLTTEERRRFSERLAVVTRELKTPKRGPAWWQR